MFSLTRQERQVILFLMATALFGTGIDFLVKRYSPERRIPSFGQNIGRINLNTAGPELLEELPGIGQKLASRIIEYRDQSGGFDSVEELKQVKGITVYRFEKIKDSLCIK
ncbi:MAG: helix-hairpin-helix domain-containing protein [Candidatus Omnitrophica bacterium]|nr:helix-hairpin-helix domain-containing protein [Candidatus Omnitrophota bacterium]